MLASNIANAATPGFKARDIDFAAELKRAEGGGAGLQATSVAHIAEGTPGFGGDALYRIPVQSSLDGNTVELSVEQTKFGENAVQYQTTLSFLNGRSEEHASELQSLMRISYAVFCLKKKKKLIINHNNRNTLSR